MNKKLSTMLLTFTLILSFSFPVFAADDDDFKDQPIVPVIQLHNQGTIYLGDSVTLVATTEKKSADIIRDSWTLVGTNMIYYGERPLKPVDGNYVNTLDFTPTAVGVYTFKYSIVTGNKNNSWYGEAESVFEVFLKTTIVVENPAAPAVANAILKEAGISHRYHISGKTYGNYVSDVAKAMENGASFKGVSKNDVDAYEAAVYAFLVEKGAQLD